MFYPVESLKRGGRFYLCWVADSWPIQFNNVGNRQLWSQDVRKLCEDLLEVMKNESGSPSSRFSLRLSSQLTRGLVRLYQKKVNNLLGEICMINAQVFRHSNKKFNIQEKSPVQHRVRGPRLKVTIPREPENVSIQVLEELLQNSGNLVGNIQEITLRESTIPEVQVPNDGFGEENLLQHLQQLTNMSVEVMLQDPNAEQQTSGFDIPVLDVTDKTQDKSRLALEQHMERISEHELSLFRKSTGANLLPPEEADKDIPEIPEIPQILPPELPVSEIEKQVEEPPVQLQHPEIEPTVERTNENLELEELEEGEVRPKRRRRRGVILDRCTKLSSNHLRSRIDNIYVELRCQDPSDDIVNLQVPAETLFRRPCRAGPKPRSNLGATLWDMFYRNLDNTSRPPVTEAEIEEVLQRTRRPSKSMLVDIPEEEHQPPQIPDLQHPEVIQPPEFTEKDIDLNISAPNIDMNVSKGYLNVSEQIQVEEMDVGDLLTQKVETLSQQAKRTSEYDRPAKRSRVGVITWSSCRQTQKILVVAEVHVAPEEEIPPEVPQLEIEIEKDTEKGVSAMLQKAGLADLSIMKHIDTPEQTEVIQNVINTTTTVGKRHDSDGSETPLGSLDRTKVSLGDSEKTTDSKRFILDQWGTEGTMLKILRCVKQGKHPQNPKTLVANGPIIQQYKRIIVARCFTSILKLKQHGFIKVQKDPDTQEILDILLGPKFD